MPFCSRPLGAALSIAALAAVTLASPGRAQQDPGAGQQTAPQAGPPPEVRPPAGPPSSPSARSIAPRRTAGSATVSAKVNLRSGPGTDSEILASIPAGSTVLVGPCEGEWCPVTWNGQSGYAIARNLNLGGSRQARVYSGRPGYQPGYPDDDGLPGYAPGYYGPPVVYGPAYYYGPRVYYGPGWGWRRRWGW
jgi:uncharacterized protein YraI